MNFVWMAVFSLVAMQVSVFLTTIYLHRSLAHQGLKLNRIVANLMHLHLALFTGIVPREWVAVHRKHHHYSDQEGDPHSPRLFGLWKVLFGNMFYYHREATNPATLVKYTPDYEQDLIDRTPFSSNGLFGGWVIFAVLFGWQWGTVAFLAQGLTYLLLNSMINSVCHIVGYRNFGNTATNLRWVAMLTGGEGYHNNHHQYPASAKFALGRLEFDPAWPVIRLLAWIRLAEVRRLPSLAAN